MVPVARRYLMAGIDVLRAVPATALAPAALLVLGPAVHTEVMLAVYAALWPVVLGTAAGVAAVYPRQYDVARILHLSRAATLRKIVDVVGGGKGIGRLLVESQQSFDAATVWGLVLLIGTQRVPAQRRGGARRGEAGLWIGPCVSHSRVWVSRPGTWPSTACASRTG